MASLPDHQSFAGTDLETSAESREWKNTGLHIALTLCFASLAVLGNAVNIDLFFGVNFLFGTIFVWLCWIFLGPISALITAIAAGLYTVLLWGHYYALLIFVFEFVFVALVLRRENNPSYLALALVVFWFLVGAPASTLCYKIGLDLPPVTVLIVVSKQVLNSLFNACTAIFLFNLLAKKPQCRIFERIRGVDARRQTPSYSGLIQASVILLVLVSIGLSEVIAIRKSFGLRIASTHTEVSKAASALKKNGMSLLTLETRYWIMHHEHPHEYQLSSNNVDDKQAIDTHAPIGLYKLSDGNKLVHLAGEPLNNLGQKLTELALTPPKDGSGTTQLLDCTDGRMFIAIRNPPNGSDYFSLWPLEILSFLTSEIGEDGIKFSCGGSVTSSGEELETRTIRDTSGDIPELRSWLAAKILNTLAISAAPKATLTISKGMRKQVLEFQAAYADVIFRLSVVAMALICLAAFFGNKLNRWLDRFAKETENFINTGEISGKALAVRFQEDRHALQWVKKLVTMMKKREQSEDLAIRNFNDLVQNSKVPIFATNLDGTIHVWNKMMQTLTGFNLKEVKGKKIQGLTDASNDVSNDLASLFGDDDSSNTSGTIEISLITKDGRQIHLQTGKTFLHDVSSAVHKSISPLSSSSQKKIYFVAQDITAAKFAYAQILNAARLTALGEMAATFAHELNQPLNTIALASGNGMAGLQQAEPDLALINNKFKRIEDQALRAGEIIHTIRQFVLQRDQSDPTTFDVNEALEYAINLTQEQMRVNSIRLDIALPSKSVLVEGSAIMFEQSILAILINAQHAVRENPPSNRQISIHHICKSCMTCERACHTRFGDAGSNVKQKAILFRIFDNGPGIPEAIIRQVFDPFVTTKPNEQGTGIGLYMAKTAIEAMQGSIRATNTGSGAEISICLPVKETPAKVKEP